MLEKIDLVHFQKKTGCNHDEVYHDIDDETGNFEAGGFEYPNLRSGLILFVCKKRLNMITMILASVRRVDRSTQNRAVSRGTSRG